MSVPLPGRMRGRGSQLVRSQAYWATPFLTKHNHAAVGSCRDEPEPRYTPGTGIARCITLECRWDSSAPQLTSRRCSPLVPAPSGAFGRSSFVRYWISLSLTMPQGVVVFLF